MENAGQQLLALVREYGTEIGAGAALLFFLTEVFFDLGRKDRRGIGANLKSVGLLLAAMGTMGYAYWSLQRDYERVSDTARAARDIVAYYDECRARLATLPAEEQSAIIGDRLSLLAQDAAEDRRSRALNTVLQSDCLALAVRRTDIRNDYPRQVTRLSRDVQLGDLLLQNPDAPGSIGETLYLAFGVNAGDFLGVGRSLPAVGSEDEGAARYNDAVVREYWAPNFCAVSTIRPDICAQRSPRVWGWRFANIDSIEGMTLREVLLRLDPEQGADTPEFAHLRARLTQPDGLETPTPLLVRLHMFSNSQYIGTTGRPEAQYVFFSSLADVIDQPVRRAYTLSGAVDRFSASERAADMRAFIWIYAPQRLQDYRLATWRNLYRYLRDAPVHPRAAEVANAAAWPPPEEPANR